MPVGTPTDVVNRAQADVARTLHLPDIKQRLAAEGVEPVGQASREFGTFLAAGLKKWGKIVADAGLRAE